MATKEGIAGTWSPAVDNTKTTEYTFTPSDPCAVVAKVTVEVTKNGRATCRESAPVCEGSTITLPATSKEGIAGTWSPAVDNTKTTEYTFTPAASACATTATLTVMVTTLAATPTKVDVNCGQKDGTITLAVTGGKAPYTYAWTGPGGFTSTDKDLTGLGAGKYDVTITDASGCKTTATATIADLNSTLAATPTKEDVNCGQKDGTITLAVT